MLKAVIFDMDGTLLDSVDQHTRAWQDAFAEFGHEVEFQAIRKEIGKGGDQLLPIFLSKQQIEEKGETLESRRGDILKQRYLSQFKPFPDVPALFKRLRGDGIGTLLATSAKADELKQYKKIVGIEDLTTAEISSEDAENSKPDPDIFHAALEKLPGVELRDIVVIGDTPHDSTAARKAGLRTIGLRCGGVPDSELRAGGCVAIYDDPADLLRRYADWSSGEL